MENKTNNQLLQLILTAIGSGGGVSNSTSQFIQDTETPIVANASGAFILVEGDIEVEDPTAAGQQIYIHNIGGNPVNLIGKIGSDTTGSTTMDKTLIVLTSVDGTAVGLEGLIWMGIKMLAVEYDNIVFTVNGSAGDVTVD